ncbi:MAG: DUF2173 family protein [Chromatiaceae bacterium]|nr:DUF2173 family protein [Chromatiaceae bacterium]
MIKQLLAIDGVMAVSRFRDDGAFVEGYGVLPEAELAALAHFAQTTSVSSRATRISCRAGINGWTPPGGWIVRGARMSVCSVANLVCTVDNADGNLSEVMEYLTEASHY